MLGLEEAARHWQAIVVQAGGDAALVAARPGATAPLDWACLVTAAAGVAATAWRWSMDRFLSVGGWEQQEEVDLVGRRSSTLAL